MNDPYRVLGVARDADSQTIKAAYRNLAKSTHPDHDQKNPYANEIFSKIHAAYSILGNVGKKQAYDGKDNGLARNSSRAQKGFRSTRASARGFNPFSSFNNVFSKKENPQPQERVKSSVENAEDMIAKIFGDAYHQKEFTKTRKAFKAAFCSAEESTKDHSKHTENTNSNTPTPLNLTLEQVLKGGRAQAILQNGKVATIKLPTNLHDGQALVFKDNNVDTKLLIRFLRHDVFSVDGTDLMMDLPIDLKHAVLGTKSFAQSLCGKKLDIKIDAWTGSDKIIKIAGYGLPKTDNSRGALFVKLRIVLPEQRNRKLEDLMRAGDKSLFM